MAKTQPNNYCIILAGGVGRRLWPASQKNLPKQFLDFFGTGRTLLQQTYDRFRRFIPLDHIFISTFTDYVPLVKEQLPDLPEENILPEPVQLNTALAAIWATWHVVLQNPDANVVVSPADQIIHYEDRFEDCITKGFEYVNTHTEFVAMGVRPTMPNTAYGYIQMGNALLNANIHTVKSFSEKPELDYANLFLESGEFLWNTGIFLWKGETMGRTLAIKSGRPVQPVEVVAEQMLTIAEEVEYIRSCFTEKIPRQIDLFVLEDCQNVRVYECNFGWADVGCWTELHEASEKDVDGNAVSGGAQVLFSGTQNSMVRLPKQMKAVIAGLDNYLVVQEGNILMICPNDDRNYVRRIINEAQVNF